MSDSLPRATNKNNTLRDVDIEYDDDNDNDDGRGRTSEWTPRACHLQVNNRVVTACLRIIDRERERLVPFRLNLPKLAHKWRNLGCHYKEDMFPAVSINFTNPRGVVNLSANGKVVSTGSKTRATTVLHIRTVAERLSRVLHQEVVIDPATFDVKNIAGSATLPRDIDLRAMAEANASICTNNEKSFSGTTLRIPDLAPVTVLVFASGNIVIAGAKKPGDLEYAFERVAPIIRQYAIPR